MMQFKRVKTALPRKAGRIRTGVTMTTRWGKAVREAAAADAAYQPLTEYPRPQMVRQEPAGSWNNLNAWWEYAITQEDLRPEQWDGRILVPFSPEAPLSGVERQLTPKEYLWYRRTITVRDPEEGRWLLHFGAVDQHCVVFVNGQKAGHHSGGYLPFTAEVTDLLCPGENELTLCVRDVSETSYLTRGKQKIARGGMFYTAQSGIWQTVWLERVPKRYIREVKITPKEDAFELAVLVDGGTAGDEASVTAEVFAPRSSAEAACDAGWFCEGDPVSEADGRIPEWNKRGEGRLKLTIPVPYGRRWSPEDPVLCGIRVQAGDDSVCLYSALRELSLAKDEEGRIRLCLNGKPCFMNGVLDQGYWPESLLTAPDDRALIHDIAEMQRLGFNMLRVHCKIESDRFYFHCDRMGMLVWQDIVNGGSSYNMPRLCYLPTFLPQMFATKTDTSQWDFRRTGREKPRSRKLWLREMQDTIRALYDHPSVVLWVLFNEGWGQFESESAAALARVLDPGRLLDAASGWFDQGAGDVRSIHNYFRKLEVIPDPDRAFAITEYGGFSLLAEGHVWNEEVYGYGMMQDPAQLRQHFAETREQILALVPEGLAAAVYTQVSDIEDECNGLLSYDREICKID